MERGVIGMEVIRYEFVGGGHRKYWEVGVQGSVLVRHWGRIGTAGQVKREECYTPGRALSRQSDLVIEKRAKGYKEVGRIDQRPKVATSTEEAIEAAYSPKPELEEIKHEKDFLTRLQRKVRETYGAEE